MSGESRLMSRNPYYCIHGAPLDRRCEACATAPDPVDDAAVEADTDTIPRGANGAAGRAEGWVKLEDVVAFLRSRYLTTTANAVLAEFGSREGTLTLRAGSTVTHAGWEGVRIELEEPFTAEGDTVVVFDVDLKAGTARVRPVGPREGTDGE